jgi:hypothetical protein
MCSELCVLHTPTSGQVVIFFSPSPISLKLAVVSSVISRTLSRTLGVSRFVPRMANCSVKWTTLRVSEKSLSEISWENFWNSGSSAYWGSSSRRQVVGCDSSAEEFWKDMMGDKGGGEQLGRVAETRRVATKCSQFNKIAAWSATRKTTFGCWYLEVGMRRFQADGRMTKLQHVRSRVGETKRRRSLRCGCLANVLIERKPELESSKLPGRLPLFCFPLQSRFDRSHFHYHDIGSSFFPVTTTSSSTENHNGAARSSHTTLPGLSYARFAPAFWTCDCLYLPVVLRDCDMDGRLG